MLKSARRCFVAATCLLLASLFLIGQTQRASRVDLQTRFARAVALTYEKGAQAKLPPHISTLLGLTREEDSPVMQGVKRDGTRVQGIDVSMADKGNVVLFVVDETTNDQTLYLTSPDGKLRRVVSVKAGEGALTRITNKERKAFEKEKKHWADVLAPAGPPH
jgi:hypothetical protein